MKLIYTSLLTLGLLTAAAHSTIIIQDDFTRTGLLPGSTASPTGGVWAGSSGSYLLDGNKVVVSNNTNGGLYYQSVSLQTNCVYLLFVTLDNTSKGSDNWLSFGFGGVVGNGDAILLRGTGEAVAFETAGTYATDTGSANDTFVIRLVTGATLSNSTVTYIRIGSGTPTSIGGVSNPTDASAFDRVFIQDIADVTGSYDNFTLDCDCVPEPSSLLLLSIAGLGWVTRRRR